MTVPQKFHTEEDRIDNVPITIHSSNTCSVVVLRETMFQKVRKHLTQVLQIHRNRSWL